MKRYLSPNFDARSSTIPLSYIVYHYTGMQTAEAAVERLCNSMSQVSAHYVIDVDGSLTQLVDEENRAWHAGKSSWQAITDLNSASIGVELVNPGHEFGYTPFPSAQISALIDLSVEITKKHHMVRRTAVLAHSDIAPARKQDPGELFPWQHLATKGLGLWPDVASEDRGDFDENLVISLLTTIGYDTQNLPETLLAFQRRYYPSSMTGKADPETAARLKSLVRRMNARTKSANGSS